MPGAIDCIKNEYMKPNTIMTVRMDADLLRALKSRAKEEGRSLSAEVVQLVRQAMAGNAPRTVRKARTMGMFANFEAPSLEDFQTERRRNARKVLRHVQTSSRAPRK